MTTQPGEEGFAMSARVLLVGEGNFSFSQALALRSASLNPAAPFITSTSFDSEREVAEKYPEAASILAKLSSHRERIKVLHEIDATQLRRHFDEQSFDEVWFNFPHLGREDLRSHIALVAHFFHSAMQVLRPGGTICLALSEEQQRIWEIHKSASRLGLVCVKCFPLKPEDWPGYHLKRHHTGRSFAGRVHDLFHYCFRASDSSSSGSASVAEGVSLLDMLQQVQQQSTPTKPAGKASRKRVHVLVDGKYATGQDGGYCCLCCSRSFPTEQGVRTHVYNVHILSEEKQGDASSSSSSATLTCEHCGRTCANADSLRQHIVAKHTGACTTILPYWKETMPLSEEANAVTSCSAADAANAASVEVNGAFACPICDWRFPDASTLDAHAKHGFEPIQEQATYECTHCGRCFGQQRALLQHANFCSVSATPGERTLEVGLDDNLS